VLKQRTVNPKGVAQVVKSFVTGADGNIDSQFLEDIMLQLGLIITNHHEKSVDVKTIFNQV
jgi:hypothetical protein